MLVFLCLRYGLSHQLTGLAMALNANVTAEDFSKLDDGIQALYVQDGDNYKLDVDGFDDGKELKEALRKEREERKARQETIDKMKEAEKQKDEEARLAIEEAARKGNDTDALDKSWQEKYVNRENELKGEYEPEIQNLKTLLHNKTVLADAMNMASEIAVPGSAKALLPHIQSRLAMEVKDGEAVTVVKGLDGKPSALTIDELKNEITNDSAFAPLIVGSKATGGGANGGNQGGGAAKTMTRSQFDGSSPSEKMSFIQDGGSVTD